MKAFIRLCLSLVFLLVQGTLIFGQEPDSIFSDVEFLGNANNYTEAVDSLWAVFTDSVDMEVVYGIIYDRPVGGNRTSILNERTYGAHGNFFVSADMKLQKRPSGGADMPLYEDGRLFFSWKNDSNYAWAQFFNTHGPAKDNPIGQGDALGLSGFMFMVDGQGYGFIHSDDPGDPVEEIPAETCIPYESDTSFYDWNEVKVMLKDSVLSMLVNGEVYHAIGLDTVTMIQYYTGNVLDTIDTIPSAVLDLLYMPGQIGIGSSNDKVYFDNVTAGWVTVEGVFSDIRYLGDAGNYTEANPWLWGVIEDSGDTRYGITAPNESGGNRMSILNDTVFGYWHLRWYIEAEARLFKRATGAPDESLFEDAVLYFSYVDENNYAGAYYFNTPGPGVAGNPQGASDAFGISGIRFVYEGQAYRLDKTDDPGDPVEEIPPERCIPFVDDNSFNDWNTIRLERDGTILTMLVNGEEYWALDVDTLTVAQIYGGDGYASWQFNKWAEVPEGAKQMLLGTGQIGVGSSNDKVYFDNIDMGFHNVTGVFSDVEFLGDAANYTEVDPWLWAVTEIDGDMRYAIRLVKEYGGKRMSILNDSMVDGDWYIQADIKLFKRLYATVNQEQNEDAGLFFCYQDMQNWATAIYSNKSASGVTVDPVGQNWAFGMSGILFFYDGQIYGITKLDDPGDPVEEIPPERCIPYEDDNSFNDWNTIKLVRDGTIFRMKVNEEEYWAIDMDTVTVAQVFSTGSGLLSQKFDRWEAVPQGAKDMLLGPGQIGICSSNDMVAFDNVDEGPYSSVGELSDPRMGHVLIFPNPASNIFTIADIDHIRKIEMYNLSGQRVMEMTTYGENSVTIQTNRFRSGMYFIKLYSDKGYVAVGKIMIE